MPTLAMALGIPPPFIKVNGRSFRASPAPPTPHPTSQSPARLYFRIPLLLRLQRVWNATCERNDTFVYFPSLVHHGAPHGYVSVSPQLTPGTPVSTGAAHIPARGAASYLALPERKRAVLMVNAEAPDSRPILAGMNVHISR